LPNGENIRLEIKNEMLQLGFREGNMNEQLKILEEKLRKKE